MNKLSKSKLFKVIAVFATVLSMSFGNLLDVVAENKAKIIVNGSKGKNGEEVTITIGIEDISEVYGANLEMTYDKGALELISVENGSLFNQDYTNKDYSKYPFIFSWGSGLEACNTATKGVAATVKFKILENASAGDKVIEVIATDTCDKDLNPIPFDSGKGVITVEKEAHVHTYGKWEIVKEATCTTDGQQQRTCTICGEKEEQVIKAKGHSWSEWKVTVKPTINAEGKQERECTVCGEKEEQVLPKIEHGDKDHKFNGKVEIIKEATCTKKGLKRIYCSFDLCDAYKEEAIEAKGHSWSEWKVIVKPTIKTEGKQERECTVCGEKEEQVLPKIVHEDKDHKFDGKEVVIKEATCSEEGIKRVYCSIDLCEAYKEVVIVKKDHTLDKWEVIEQATCDKDGKKIQKCKVCNEIINTEMIPAVGHKWNQWETIKEATCTSTGLEKRICSVCGKEETREVPLKVHTLGEWEVTEQATCDSNGQKIQRCKVCNEIINTEVIPTMGHQWNEWKTVEEATCTTTGLEKRICDVCGKEETREIALEEHIFGEWVVTKEATEKEQGLKERICEICGEKEEVIIPSIKIDEEQVKPDNKSEKKEKTIKTGDNNSMFGYMLAIGLTGIVGLTLLNKKRES